MRAHAVRLLAPGMLGVLIGACGGSGTGESAKPADAAKPAAAAPTAAAAPAQAKPQPGPPQSAALPADGGEVGKQYRELIAALQAGDYVRSSKLVYQADPKNPYVSAKADVEDLLPNMQKLHVVGGVWQADRATLFLDDGAALHGYVSASLTDTGWLLDFVVPRSADDDFLRVYKCTTSKFFPCAAKTFPDAKVSGTIKPYPASAYAGAPPSKVVLDGFGVRGFDAKTRALAYTEIILSADAFEPHFFGTEDLASHEGDSSPAFRLRIAPDGKSAKLGYVARAPEIDATSGLSVDFSTPNRARGHFKMDVKDVAQFDVNFDVGTASECLLDGDTRCGNAH